MDEVINLSTTLSVILQLGRVGENNVNEITFDFSDWQSEFGEGTVSLVCKRHTDAEGYPVSLTVDGTEATWLVSSTDVAYEGIGQAQVTYMVNGVIKKSVIYMTKTCPSIEPVSPTPPDPYASWLDQMIEAKDDAEAARDEAVEAAEDLTEMANTFPALLVTGSSSGSIATFDDGSETPVKSLSVNIDPVQTGSGDPSPTNVRPISGWDGVNVTVVGKNLLKPHPQASMTNQIVMTNNNGQYSFSGSNSARVNFNIPVDIAPGEYTLSALNPVASGYSNIYLMSAGGEVIVNVSCGTANKIQTFTLTEPIKTVRLTFSAGASLDNYKLSPVIVLGETASDEFIPYSGTVYPISLPSTVYGGVLDVGTGELTVTKKMVDLGTLNWALNTGSDGTIVFSSAGLTDKKVGVTNILCSSYLTTSVTSWAQSKPNYSICGSASSITIVIRDDRFSSASDLKTALSGVQVVYELATSQTISLTPTEVRTILGYNNIYADSGSVDVVYYRDLDIVINRLLEGSAS